MRFLFLENECSSHYVYIKNFICRINQSIIFCMNDFQYFNSKETSTNCKAYLEINGKQANEILKRGSNIKFTGYHKQ